MENQSSFLASTWLKPIISLLKENDFEEAYAVADYLPATLGRLLVQSVALLGQKKIAEADDLLCKLSSPISEMVHDFAIITKQIEIDLIEVYTEAIASNKPRFYLAHLCLEAELLNHPNSLEVVSEKMIGLASQALKAGNLKLTQNYLDRIHTTTLVKMERRLIDNFIEVNFDFVNQLFKYRELDLGLNYLEMMVEIDQSQSRIFQYVTLVIDTINNQQGIIVKSFYKFAEKKLEYLINNLYKTDIDNVSYVVKNIIKCPNFFIVNYWLIEQLLVKYFSQKSMIYEIICPLAKEQKCFEIIVKLIVNFLEENNSISTYLIKSYRYLPNNLSDFEKGKYLLSALNYLGTERSLRLAKSVLIDFIRQDMMAESDALLQSLHLEILEQVANLAALFARVDINLYNVSIQAFKNKHLHLSYFTLEIYFYTHPESVFFMINSMLSLAYEALKASIFDYGVECFERMLEIDNSPENLIRYAQFILDYKRPRTKSLVGFLKNLQGYVNQLPLEESQAKLRIAEILITYEVSLEISLDILEKLLYINSSLEPQISASIFYIVESKPYFSLVADFLIKINPRNIEQVIARLVKAFQRPWGNLSHLGKAKSLLYTLDYAALGYASEYIRASAMLENYYKT